MGGGALMTRPRDRVPRGGAGSDVGEEASGSAAGAPGSRRADVRGVLADPPPFTSDLFERGSPV